MFVAWAFGSARTVPGGVPGLARRRWFCEARFLRALFTAFPFFAERNPLADLDRNLVGGYNFLLPTRNQF